MPYFTMFFLGFFFCLSYTAAAAAAVIKKGSIDTKNYASCFFFLMIAYTQLSGTRVAINIFLIACTFMSKSMPGSSLESGKYVPKIKSCCVGTFVVTDLRSKFFGRFS